jgi:hypothetical protein
VPAGGAPRSQVDNYTEAPVSPRRYWILACLLVMSLGLAACGREAHPTVADADNDGFYVDAGPITYQLQISRQLNQYNTEDRQYLQGLPAGTLPPKPDELWYAVFLWAKNQGDKPAATTDNFTIVDTQGNTYFPIHLNPLQNPFAWTSQVLLPDASEPGLDTIANQGPTQASLLLFKLPTTVYSDRPLTLKIHVPGQAEASTISLNL